MEWLSGNRAKGTKQERYDITNGLGTNTGGWVECGRAVLEADATSITLTNIANKRFYMVFINIESLAGYSTAHDMRFGTGGVVDTGSNYNSEIRRNGSDLWGAQGGTSFQLTTTFNPSAPFLLTWITNNQDTFKAYRGLGARTTNSLFDKDHLDVGGTWENSTDLLDTINIFDQSKELGRGTSILVLGYDDNIPQSHNFWEEIGSSTGDNEVISTKPKNYNWISCDLTLTNGTTTTPSFQLGNHSIISDSQYYTAAQGYPYSHMNNLDGTFTDYSSTLPYYTDFELGAINHTANVYLHMDLFSFKRSAFGGQYESKTNNICMYTWKEGNGSNVITHRQTLVGGWIPNGDLRRFKINSSDTTVNNIKWWGGN